MSRVIPQSEYIKYLEAALMAATYKLDDSETFESPDGRDSYNVFNMRQMVVQQQVARQETPPTNLQDVLFRNQGWSAEMHPSAMGTARVVLTRHDISPTRSEQRVAAPNDFSATLIALERELREYKH